MARRELPDDSLAARVLDSRQEARDEARSAEERLSNRAPAPSNSPAGLVLASTASRTTVFVWAGLIVALLLHAGLFVLVIALDLGSSVADLAQPDSQSMEISHVVDLEPPAPEPEPEAAPAPEPEPEVEPEVEPKPAPDVEAEPVETPEPTEPEPATEPAESDEPPAAAEAGQVATADEDSQEIADFTDFDITQGSGTEYAGGTTTSSGTNKNAVRTKNVKKGGRTDSGKSARPKKSKARPVSLPAREWDCPWPKKADDLSIDEQTVTLRAVVDSEGRATSVTVVSDPGFGFGAKARECAQNNEFLPAIDDEGRPYTATSPPIRIQFTRD
jgi:protein TonB